MARTAKNEKALTPEEKLAQALVPDVEQPYRVPENWRWTNLKTIADILNGFAFKSAKYVDSGIRIIRIANVQDGYVEDDAPVYYPVDSQQEIKRFLLQENDLLISLTGNVGRVALLPLSFLPAALNQRVACLRITSECLIKKYLFYSLLRDSFQKECIKSSKGSAQLNMSTEWLKEQAFPLAPLAEQQRIVDRIESLFAKLDEAKEKAQAVVDGFEDRRAAILHKAFTGELTEEWRRDNSISKESWKLVGFDDCVDAMQNGIAKRKGFTGEPYVVLRLANLSDDGFDETDLREIVLDEKEQKNYELHSDDVLMVRVNGSKDNVGKQYLITNQKRWAFCDHIIRIKYVNSIVPQYMVYFSKSETYRQYIKDNMVSSAGQNTISRKGMARLQIPMPQKDEQEQIVSILSNLFEKEQQAKEAAEQVIDQIDAMKKAIIARAFRGELGTNDPADEPAIELLKKL